MDKQLFVFLKGVCVLSYSVRKLLCSRGLGPDTTCHVYSKDNKPRKEKIKWRSTKFKFEWIVWNSPGQKILCSSTHGLWRLPKVKLKQNEPKQTEESSNVFFFFKCKHNHCVNIWFFFAFMSAVLVFRCSNSISTVFWLSCFSVFSMFI